MAALNMIKGIIVVMLIFCLRNCFVVVVIVIVKKYSKVLKQSNWQIVNIQLFCYECKIIYCLFSIGNKRQLLQIL